MKVHSVDFNAKKILKKDEEEIKRFRKETNLTNIIYFFFTKRGKCTYIGESKKSLNHRCFKNTPPHIEKSWFKRCNNVVILKLDDDISDIARHTIEQVFILSYKASGHRLNNLK